jgi:hypothetical protein
MADATKYLLGGGTVWFDDGKGLLNFGNIPALSLVRAIEKLEHFTPQDGQRKKDKSIITSASIAVNLTMDEMSKNNLDLLMYGDGDTVIDQSSGTAVTELATTPIELDRSIFTEFQAISALVVTGAAGTPVYVLGTDYELEDAAEGAIKILSGGTVTAALPIEIDYTYDDIVRNQVLPGTDFVKEGNARILFKTSAGLKFMWIIPNCALEVDGETDLSAETWSEAAVSLQVLVDQALAATQPYGRIIQAA